jgi:ABC-2 type transport system ATP-binding protein
MRYGAHEVVRGIDLSVAYGEVFAFLGPNGAGKTTTVEILEGFRQRTGGDVEVLGIDPRDAGLAWRNRVGVVLQSSTPEPDLSVTETIALYAGFYPRPLPTDRILDLVGLSEQRSTRNRRLSGGQQRRLDVALALVGDPDLLFLDEPTTGFDPAARRAAWGTIKELKALGKTIFLTTHYLEEAEYLADTIAVIADGQIVATGTPSNLGDRDQRPSTISFVAPALVPDVLSEGLRCRLQLNDDGRISIESTDLTTDLLELTRWAGERGVSLQALDVHQPTLEETYLNLTDRSTRP